MPAHATTGPSFSITHGVRETIPGLSVVCRLFQRHHEPASQERAVVLPEGVTLESLKDHPVARAYRDLSWRLGIDPTKRRPSGEALARRVLGGEGIPRIHPLVDAYNRASAGALVPLSAFDVAALHTDLRLDVAVLAERFHGIGRPSEPLTGRELV